MKTWYVLRSIINGNPSYYRFSAEDEAEKEWKLKRWKDEHMTSYNEVKVIDLMTDEQIEVLLPRGIYNNN